MIADIHSYQEVDTQSSYCLSRLGHSCGTLRIEPALGFHVRASFLVRRERIRITIARDFRAPMAKSHFHAVRVIQDLSVKISQYSLEYFIARRNLQMIKS